MNRIGSNLICTAANEEIIRALVRFNAEFIVIGGLAMAWHVQARQANDMDLLINPTEENSSRVHSALVSLGLQGLSPSSFSRLGVQASLKSRHFADLITPTEQGPGFAEVMASTEQAALFSIAVRVPSVHMLIVLKRLAVAADPENAGKHERDIELLMSAAV